MKIIELMWLVRYQNLNIINKSKQMHLNGGWNINIITFNHYDWIIDFGGSTCELWNKFIKR